MEEIDKYYLLYEMMMHSLKTDDVLDGLNKTLFLLKSYLNSGNIILHKKNENGVYVQDICDITAKDINSSVSCIVGKISLLVEHKQVFELDLNLSDDFSNMLLIHLKVHDHDYILSINNYNPPKKVDEDFWYMVQDTMQVILKRAEMYERNTKAINVDLLTGLENRNSYEKRIQSIDASDELVYGIFDLFRLKYVNDNYSHSLGDAYIREVAKILDKYWPVRKKILVDGMEKSVETGHSVYRVGGDEFILLTNRENIDLTNIKAKLASEEVSLINLGIENLPLGLNYGVVPHMAGDSIRDTYEKADHIMSEDKREMYARYGLDRRR